MFVAGRITGERGWSDAAVISVADLIDVKPTGDPLVVVADEGQITAMAARLITSIAAVERDIMVVTPELPAPDVLAWMDAELIATPGSKEVPRLLENDSTDAPTVDDILAEADLPGLLQPTPSLEPDEGERPQAKEAPDKSQAKPKAKVKPKASAKPKRASTARERGRVSSEAMREFQSLAAD